MVSEVKLQLVAISPLGALWLVKETMPLALI
jgi:hypothetical protein